MAVRDEKNTNNNRNFTPADAFLRPRLVVRNKETGEIISDNEWICKDVALYAKSKAGKSMIAKSEQNPDHVFELSATVHVPQEEDENQELFDL